MTSATTSVRVAVVLVALGSGSAVARAQTTNASVRDMQEACGEVTASQPGSQRAGHLVDCGYRLFSLEPIAPAIGSIVPGGGAGAGVKVQWKPFSSENVETAFRAGARGTLGGFWIADAELEFQQHVLDGANYNPNYTLYVAHINLPHMDFYGLSGHTPRTEPVEYRFTETYGGFRGEYPITVEEHDNSITGERRFGAAVLVGGLVELRDPHVAGATFSGRDSIDQVFTEQDTPGLLPGPDVALHGEASLGYRRPIRDPRTELSTSFGVFRDLQNDGRYSFRRAEVLGRQTIVENQSFGQLDLRARFSTADASSGGSVPFYDQETLGGSDIHGRDTLRGYRDYRFRASHLALIQVDYEHPFTLVIPRKTMAGNRVDLAALVFYDAGAAELRRADLNAAHAHQTYGAGLGLRVGNRTVARAYVGLGSGEGTRFFFDLSTLSLQ